MRGICNLLYAYHKQYKVKTLTLYGIKDQWQTFNSEICGNYCYFFLYNLLHKNENCSTHETTCTINTIRTFLRENFCEGSTTGRLMNSNIIEKFTGEYIMPTTTAKETTTNLFIQFMYLSKNKKDKDNCLDLDKVTLTSSPKVTLL